MSSMTERALGDKKLLFVSDTEVLFICRSQTKRIMGTIAIHCLWTTGVLDWLWIALHQVRSWSEGWKIYQDRRRIGRETWSSYAHWTVSLYTFTHIYTVIYHFISFLKVSSEICSEDQVGVAWAGFVRVQVISSQFIRTCFMSFGRHWACKLSVLEPLNGFCCYQTPATVVSEGLEQMEHACCMTGYRI